MARVSDFYSFIDSLAPFTTQEEWDNSGMLIGDETREVTRVALMLDITNEAVERAADAGAELIISHHPVIFKPQKNILKGNPAFTLISKGLSAICAHTCLDSADGGVNDVLAELLEIENAEVFPCAGCNIMRAGVLPRPMSAYELAEHIRLRLGGSVRFCDSGKIIESVALCGGSGSSFISETAKAGIDAFITGDAGHHDFLDSKESGLSLFAAGHFETENPVISVLANRLRTEFPDTDIIVIAQSTPIQTI